MTDQADMEFNEEIKEAAEEEEEEILLFKEIEKLGVGEEEEVEEAGAQEANFSEYEDTVAPDEMREKQRSRDDSYGMNVNFSCGGSPDLPDNDKATNNEADADLGRSNNSDADADAGDADAEDAAAEAGEADAGRSSNRRADLTSLLDRENFAIQERTEFGEQRENMATAGAASNAAAGAAPGSVAGAASNTATGALPGSAAGAASNTVTGAATGSAAGAASADLAANSAGTKRKIYRAAEATRGLSAENDAETTAERSIP